MRQSVMAGGMPFLPEEMIRNILMRLPVKSLLRFRCVCKNWRNLITTPYFIYEHLRHSTHQNPCLLFQWNGLWLLDCKMQFHKVEEVPLVDSLNTSPLIIGSSNGLLCFYVYGYHTFSPHIFLWNPTTKKFRQVPPNIKVVDIHFQIGFGFSPIVNDYKIVLYHESSHKVAHVEVYSLRSGSWKEIEFGIENVGFISQQITVNGAIFWFGVRWEPAKVNGAIFWFRARLEPAIVYNVIVSFDIANEVFSLIPTPDASASKSGFAVYDNKLAVLSFSPIQGSESLVNLWVMEDGTGASWVKKYSCSILFLARPLTIWMNQIVCHVIKNEGLVWTDKVEIALLNISTYEVKTFDIIRCGDGFGSGFKLQYAESLHPSFG